MKIKNLVISLIVLSLLITSTVQASSLSGSIVDQSGRPIKAASITVVCNSKTYTGKSNNYGQYSVGNLPDVVWCQMKVSANSILTQAFRVNSGTGINEINLKLKKVNGGWVLTYN